LRAEMEPARPVHDLGGEPAGRCVRTPHPLQDWERRVDATMMVLWGARRVTVDEMRRHIESMGRREYLEAGYYERWAGALAAMIVERGLVSAEELAQRLAATP